MAALDEEYAMCWNDHANNLSISFKDLLQNKELMDVTLFADGHLFNAHQLVLAAISPYFRQIFTQVPANQQAFGMTLYLILKIFQLKFFTISPAKYSTFYSFHKRCVQTGPRRFDHLHLFG